VTNSTEQEITNGIIKVVSGKKEEGVKHGGATEKTEKASEATREGTRTSQWRDRRGKYVWGKVRPRGRRGGRRCPTTRTGLVVAGPKNDSARRDSTRF